MKKIAFLLLLLSCPAFAQDAPKPEATYTVTLTRDELLGITALGNIACKSRGIDDGGSACAAAIKLNEKLNAVLKQESK